MLKERGEIKESLRTCKFYVSHFPKFASPSVSQCVAAVGTGDESYHRNILVIKEFVAPGLRARLAHKTVCRL